MKSTPSPKPTSPPESEEQLAVLKTRFDRHPERHPGIQWKDALARLKAHPEKWAALAGMESTGGEPDVIGRIPVSGAIYHNGAQSYYAVRGFRARLVV